MASVQLLNITKKFDDVTAVSELNLTIKDGEFFSLLGPSGCGKTTVLRMVAGFYTPTNGQILFNGKNVSTLPPNKRNTGMVFQNYALFPHMTVFENVTFGLKARKVPASDRRGRAEGALELVNLADYMDRKVTQLSGGQQQRVALARAIVIEPEILLLDEPLSNLDAKLRRDTRIQIQKLQQKLGITTIYVTHDQEEALTLSDRIALMEGGVCKQVGTPDEIYNHPNNAFVASFIGRSNLINGIIKEFNKNAFLVEITEEIKIYVSNTDLEENQTSQLVGKDITLAIRPETIVLRKSKGNETNVFEGEVKFRQFNGYMVEYEIDMQGIGLNVIMLNEENSVFHVQDKVYVHIPENKVKMLDTG